MTASLALAMLAMGLVAPLLTAPPGSPILAGGSLILSGLGGSIATPRGWKTERYGRSRSVARGIAVAAGNAGANVIVAGRHPDALRDAYPDRDFTVETVDLTDEQSIADLANRLGTIDHLISTGSARARGVLRELDRDAIRLSFDTKVIGPLMLAKHFADRFTRQGSFTFFSGVAAFKPVVGYLGVAITNGLPTSSDDPSPSKWHLCE